MDVTSITFLYGLEFFSVWIPISLINCDLSHLFVYVALPDLGSSFWGMLLILASTNLLTARIAAGCFLAALFITLFIAKNVSTVISQKKIVSTDEHVFYLIMKITCLI